MQHCRADYTEVWVSSPCVPLIRFADKVRALSSTGLDFLELGLPSPATASLSEFDSIVSWYGTNRTEFRDAVRDFPFQFCQTMPNPDGTHAVDFCLRQVSAPEGGVPAIEARADRREFVAIHPFSGSIRKNWPLDSYRRLASELPLSAEFCAGPEEELAGAVRHGGLDQVAQWLASARVYVGNDSGISHLAAAVGIPAVVIFRDTDPRVWAPRGRSPVRVFEGTPTVDEVRAAVMELLLSPV